MLRRSIAIAGVTCGVSLGVVGFTTRKRLRAEQAALPTSYLSVFQDPEVGRKRAIVIGGGVAGVSTAHHLQDKGYEVVVLDANSSGAGKECSAASAGGMQKMNVRVDRNSYIATMKQLFPFQTFKFFHINYLRCASDPHWWRWMYAFTRASFSFQMHQVREAQMLKCTVEAIDMLRAKLSADPKLAKAIGYSESGAFRLLASEEEAVQMASTVDPHWLPDLDVEPARLLDAQQTAALIPWLPERLTRYGAIQQTSAARGNSAVFTEELAQLLDVRPGVRVLNFSLDAHSKRVTELQTSQGKIAVPLGTAVVVAAGAHSVWLMHKLGYFCPVYPLKGYNLLVEVPHEAALDHIVAFGKLYFSRLGDQLRVATIGEFDGWNNVPSAEIEALVRRKAAQVLPFELQEALAAARLVTGLRPLVSDGSIILGQVSSTNLFLNVGPGFNGWKMGYGCGKLLADMIDQGQVAYPELTPKGRVLHSPKFAALCLIVNEMFH